MHITVKETDGKVIQSIEIHFLSEEEMNHEEDSQENAEAHEELD